MTDQNVVQLIRAGISSLTVAPNQVFELRALDVPSRYGKPKTVAGWFDDLDQLAVAAAQLEERGARGVYVTLNWVNPALLARAYNRLDEHPKTLTGDGDILRRVWLPFDFDPVRPAGISSNDEELAAAKARAQDAVAWLETQIKDRPAVWAFSGNGYHALFRTELPNNSISTEQVKRLIDGTADKFSDNVVAVDRTVFNAGRIWKLYGSVARKGDAVPRLGRVHRRSVVLGPGFEPC